MGEYIALVLVYSLYLSFIPSSAHSLATFPVPSAATIQKHVPVRQPIAAIAVLVLTMTWLQSWRRQRNTSSSTAIQCTPAGRRTSATAR